MNIIFRAIFLAAAGLFPESQILQAEELQKIRDCPADQHCPEMIALPGTTAPVQLGSPEGETGRVDNEALHPVALKPFAIAKYETSVAEYLACVTAKACRPPEWLDPTSPHHITQGTGFYYRNLGSAITDPGQPVVGVSHSDAVTYAAWLSKVTGKDYRLPSENEWEYAARAGTTSPYWWGTEVKSSAGAAQAHCRGCGGTTDGKAAGPVASFSPNPFGLFNMNGNVWEWTADYYCKDMTLSPNDGSARAADDCPEKDADDLRVFRGGSSFYGPDKMRSASRLRQYSNFRNFSVGFRVARSLEK